MIFPPEPSKECVKVSHVIFECTVINHHPILSDVPKDTFLGTTLFVLFLNDITLGIDKNTNIVDVSVPEEPIGPSGSQDSCFKRAKC